ncbi:hypothetical protein GUITHDRAFT_139979 [Guillardia theta CCMP2712]|uniref:Uncharacterized protein n=1 Tax=Guillardia theta (strain CCMP2712) TaxID=905079 RepID=L1J6I3_GUITC|nr:hypothetical protein GUITHDRAFT_139979 [Guillardia theta CCMP2712]EKX44131.1 hypothetical protein GUITHDRAFT_139979 [Guillardia theta CCMP2712]|eukprot:XP_005831111.1 hypothetical protein GUITHDRAFT_139979 [Guillardia theta CCMP2712]
MVGQSQSFVLPSSFCSLTSALSKHDAIVSSRARRPSGVALRTNSIRMEGTMVADRKQSDMPDIPHKVTYFGKSKILSDVQLFKFNFFQRKFDHLVAQGKAKEAVEVLIASESMIQISPLQAVKLLVDLFQSGLTLSPSKGTKYAGQEAEQSPGEDQTKASFSLAAWRAREMIEREIRYAEMKLGKRWKSVELRHDLLEIQPYFYYKLNVSGVDDIVETPELDESIATLWEHLSAGEAKVSAAALREALSKEWQLSYENDSVLEDILVREAGESPAGFEAFRKMCLLVLQI